jgi:hypothetical protein
METVEISTFHCPRCRVVLQISGVPKPEKILRCTQCEFIFPASLTELAAMPQREAREELKWETGSIHSEYPAAATWTDWPTSGSLAESPLACYPAPPEHNLPLRPRPRRFRPRRQPFPWIFLIVGILVGLASVGLIIVITVALWPKR